VLGLGALTQAKCAYFVVTRGRSIICAICSCSCAIFVKPFFRKPFARARCHSGVA
jgi:hypothetical protein